jgi:hypothetical protein
MAATLVLGTNVERRVGSSPTLVTKTLTAFKKSKLQISLTIQKDIVYLLHNKQVNKFFENIVIRRRSFGLVVNNIRPHIVVK